jgi:hypothetical protein
MVIAFMLFKDLRQPKAPGMLEQLGQTTEQKEQVTLY